MKTIAAITAALAGDIENAVVVASTPSGIERQEAAGQQTLCRSAIIPKQIRGATRGQLTAIGFEFGTDADEIFVNCELPDGWQKVATDHPMHSDLVDDKGRPRAGIFYKAAFYDRRADMQMNRRFNVNMYLDGSEGHYKGVVTDGKEVAKDFGEWEKSNYKASDAIENEATAWLDQNWPDWRNPLAYWV